MELKLAVPTLIFALFYFPCRVFSCPSLAYNFTIDLDVHYDEQDEFGWIINLQENPDHVWFYHETWPGLDGTGVFLINQDSGAFMERFDLSAYFFDHADGHSFEFELKYFSRAQASLNNVIIDGEEVESRFLQTSVDGVWNVIQFQSVGPLLPLPVPRLLVRIPNNADEFFLIEYLSTRICDDLATPPTTGPTTESTSTTEITTTDSTTQGTTTGTAETTISTTTRISTEFTSYTTQSTISGPFSTESFIPATPAPSWNDFFDPLTILLFCIDSLLLICLCILCIKYCCGSRRGGVRKKSNFTTHNYAYSLPRAATPSQRRMGSE